MDSFHGLCDMHLLFSSLFCFSSSFSVLVFFTLVFVYLDVACLEWLLSFFDCMLNPFISRLLMYLSMIVNEIQVYMEYVVFD